MDNINNDNFSLDRTLEILEQTPKTLMHLISNLSDFWTTANEGQDTWSVFDVIGHLVHGEKTDWMVRAKIILSDVEEKHFEPFDRFAQLETSKGKTMQDLLREFMSIREENLKELKAMKLGPDDFSKVGIHPKFGSVTLKQLLSTWTVHDLNHISQIARIMAKQYKEETGPWVEFLGVLKG